MEDLEIHKRGALEEGASFMLQYNNQGSLITSLICSLFLVLK